ncbi:MAG: hypothetical protein M1434_03630 [Chloroflexi bacterium]|nr:hypothetical protein [Chloroflexota bacterium]MCL5273822.1 hypothetical protein [Chloroflexota bacterium]
MDMKAFKESLNLEMPPEALSEALKALWFDANDDWHTAHSHAQAQDDRLGAWVHAYLHRKEGDLSNAAYWYRRAGQPVPAGDLSDEWDAITTSLLADAK